VDPVVYFVALNTPLKMPKTPDIKIQNKRYIKKYKTG